MLFIYRHHLILDKISRGQYNYCILTGLPQGFPEIIHDKHEVHNVNRRLAKVYEGDQKNSDDFWRWKVSRNFHAIECKVISYFYCNFNLLEFFPHFHIDYYHFICKRRNLFWTVNNVIKQRRATSWICWINHYNYCY